MRRTLLAMAATAIALGMLCILVIAPTVAPSWEDELAEAVRADTMREPMRDLTDSSGPWRVAGWVAVGLGVVLGVGGLTAPARRS